MLLIGIGLSIVLILTLVFIGKILKRVWDKYSKHKTVKDIPKGFLISIILVFFTLVTYLFLLIVIIPLGIELMNKMIYDNKLLEQDFIMKNISHLIAIFTIPLTILAAFTASNKYLADRKSRVITENRIDWMYKIREYIINLNNEVNKYLDCEHQNYKKLKGINKNINNYIEEIILYLAPESENNLINVGDLDYELENRLIKLKKAVNDDCINFYNDSKRNQIREEKEGLLFISRIYFKIEWERVKYEAINDSQGLYNTNKEYKENYKNIYERG